MRGAMILLAASLAGCVGSEIDGNLATPRDDAGMEGALLDAAPADDAEPARDAANNEPALDAGVAGEPDAAVPADSWPSDWASREDAMLVLVNELRASGTVCGARNYPSVPALAMNAELRSAARLHSQDMAEQNYFDHNSLDGRDPWDRIRDSGYAGFGVGENIAAGGASAEAAFQQWVNSPGHCSNMMSSDAREIGVGYAFGANSTYGHYWTQTFGQ